MNTLLNNDITPRKGCVDLWNSAMVKGATFTLGNDIPICPCDKIIIPNKLVSYEEAKGIYKKSIEKDKNFHFDAFVHFYIDDYKFDNAKNGIWNNCHNALEILSHFSGVITPDYSTYLDFPDPIKRYNTYRMRAFGFWLTTKGIYVINNVRWGTEETWDYCFDGIPYRSIVSIGTVASGIRMIKNRPLFEDGLHKMVSILNPSTIIIYGSANYTCFKELEKNGINIVQFPSRTSLAFSARKGGENNE